MPQQLGRDYQTREFGDQRVDAQAAGGAGASAPSSIRNPNVQRTSDIAAEGISKALTQYGNDAFQNSVMTGYLDGQRARMEGKAFDEIESNPLTRPFTRGGYQDEDYKLQQAKMSQSMQQYIQGEGQSQPPEVFRQRLAQEAGSVLSSMGEGMTAQGRAQALQSQTQLEASLTAAHAKAYQRYSVQEAGKRWTTAGNGIINDANQARELNDPDTIKANNSRVISFVSEALHSPNLPEQMRGAVAGGFVQTLLDNDHRDVVQAMQQSGLLDSLSFEDQQKVAQGVRASAKRTQAKDNFGNYAYDSQFKEDIKQGNITDPNDVQAYAQRRLQEGASEGELRSIYDTFSHSQGNLHAAQVNNAAYDSGDINALYANGTDPKTWANKYYSFMAKNTPNVSTSQRDMYFIGKSEQFGVIPDGTKQNIQGAVRAAQQGPMNPEQQQLLSGVMEQYNTMRQNGNVGAASALLGQFPSDVSQQLTVVANRVQDGASLADAFGDMAAAQQQSAQMSDAQKVARSKKVADAATSKIEGMFGSYSTLGGLRNGLGLAFGHGRQSTNPANYAALEGEVRQQVLRNSMNPNLLTQFRDDGSDAVAYALQQVQSRTLNVGSGGFRGNANTQLVLPQGVSPETVFGTSDKDAIGRELDKQYGDVGDGYSAIYRMDAQGNLHVGAADDSGVVHADKVIENPKAIGQAVDAERDRISREHNAANFGTTYNGGSGLDIRYDGNSTTGLDPRSVLSWRKQLMQREGIRGEAYTDTEGNTTVGVGHKGGTAGTKWDAAKISQHFQQDSNKALIQASQVAQSLGVQDEQAVLGIAGAMFQLGKGGFDKFTDAKAAIRNRDWAAFKHAVRDSKWYRQTPVRARDFMSAMRNHFPGIAGQNYL